MSEVKTPTVGRQVHYSPASADYDAVSRANGCAVLPATVIQVWGTGACCINLSVQTMCADAPVVLRYSVSHKSQAAEGQAYWDWPEIK